MNASPSIKGEKSTLLHKKGIHLDVSKRKSDFFSRDTSVPSSLNTSVLGNQAILYHHQSTADHTHPQIQRKCISCAQDEKLLQRKTEHDIQHNSQIDDISDQDVDKVQPRLTIGEVNDPLEAEADRVADAVMQRAYSPADDDKNEIDSAATSVQRKTQAGASQPNSASGHFERSLNRTQSGGFPIHSALRRHMETGFGRDFSSVRIHTDANSATLNRDIQSRAFTYGKDIYFNSGEYRPNNKDGQWLLAHELTHVVQQNPDIRRKAQSRVSKNAVYSNTAQNTSPLSPGGVIQRKIFGTLSFGPKFGMPSGTNIHANALPLFADGSVNTDLFIEAKIPGANKRDVDTGKFGIADFYRGKTSNRTIGVNFNVAGEPVALNKDSKLKFSGNSKYNHTTESAPRGGFKIAPLIRRIDQAPTAVELGDLKPGHSGEMYLGQNQLSNYQAGITDTATKVNQHPSVAGATPPINWSVTPTKMKTLDIPNKLKKSSTKGFSHEALAVYENGKKKVVLDSGLTGSMVVYKSTVPGIWAYEWLPIDMSKKTGSKEVNTVLDRLEKDVIPIINGTGKQKGSPKLKSALRQGPGITAISPTSTPIIRRAPEKNKMTFDAAHWRRTYGIWKQSAQKVKPDANLLEAAIAAEKRTKQSLGVSQQFKAQRPALKKVSHWEKHGGLYAWLRKVFGSFYLKIQNFVVKIKEKMKRLGRSSGGSSFGSWVKAAAKAIFKVFKMYGSWAVTQIADKLLTSFQTGVQNNINKLVNSITPEGVKSKIEAFHEKRQQLEQKVASIQNTIEKKLFGNHLKLFDNLNKFMAIANTVSTIVSVVKWGIRIVACASPPLVGCLWNLAISALQIVFAKIMETCWFQKEVFAWMRKSSGVSLIADIMKFPTTVAQFVVKQANTILPLPPGAMPLFAPITINTSAFKMDCGSGGGGGVAAMTPEQRELFKLVQDIGEKKFQALLRVIMKRGAGAKVRLDAKRLKAIKPLLDKLTVEQLNKAVDSPSSAQTGPLNQLLKDIAKLNKEEKAADKNRGIDYKRARKRNKAQKNQLGWNPRIFVKKDVAIDSDDFADAIFDIQKILGVKTDGIVGPTTIVRFYNRNRLGRDTTYSKAQQKLEEQKIKYILSKPLPAKSVLISDLNKINWSTVPIDGVRFATIGGRHLILARSNAGSKLGAHYHPMLTRFKGKPLYVILKVSMFTNLDAIGSAEFFTLMKERLTGKKMAFEMILTKLRSAPAHADFDLGGPFVKVALGSKVP